MSAFSTAKPKKINPLDKAIKKNPKYEHIQSTLDTGSSLTKYLKKIEEIKTNYRYQQDEIFKRMKITTFVQLLLQVAEVDTVENDSFMDFESQRYSSYDGYSNRNADALATISDRHVSPVPSLALTEHDFGATQTNRHSTLQSVIRGIGELDVEDKENSAYKFAKAEKNLNRLKQNLDLPYLLLDLRDPDEFNECHIISALNYPTAMLSRSVNNETPELLAYKNQSGKIIVVYDDDERLGPRAATTLVQRGYDNLFLLSGGMKLAHKKFPEGLLTGVVPKYYALPTPKDPKSNRNLATAMSSVSTVSNSSSVTKKTFERDDLEKLNQYLDEQLMPNDPTSRLSRATKSSRNSNVASVASTKTLTSIHEKPWKPA